MHPNTDTDLDIATPEALPAVLRRAAQLYRESANELPCTWQDESAGLIWGKLADTLEAAASSAERKLADWKEN